LAITVDGNLSVPIISIAVMSDGLPVVSYTANPTGRSGETKIVILRCETTACRR